MEIAAESGLGTTLLGNLMVANRPLATPAVLAIPIARLTLTPWHAVLIIVGTLVLALTKNKAGLDHCRCGGAWFGASVAFRRCA